MMALGAGTLILAALAWTRGQFSLIDVGGTLGAIVAVIAFPYLLELGGVITEWVYRGLFLIIAVWILGYGTRHDDRFVINISFVAFGAEAIVIYFDTFDTLLNQSLFFAVGGVLLIALSVALDRLRRRVIGGTEAEVAA